MGRRVNKVVTPLLGRVTEHMEVVGSDGEHHARGMTEVPHPRNGLLAQVAALAGAEGVGQVRLLRQHARAGGQHDQQRDPHQHAHRDTLPVKPTGGGAARLSDLTCGQAIITGGAT